MKILSSFTHPQVVLNLYEFLSSAEHKEDILKNVSNQRQDFHFEVNYPFKVFY